MILSMKGPMRPRLVPVMIVLFAAAPAATAVAADRTTVAITIRDHKFHPATVEVPANQRIRLEVTNADATAEEFESYPLNREKIIPGGSKGVIFIGPLSPGSYPFFGDFHQKTAQGRIVAK